MPRPHAPGEVRRCAICNNYWGRYVCVDCRAAVCKFCIEQHDCEDESKEAA